MKIFNSNIDAPGQSRPEVYLPNALLKQAPSKKSFFTYLYVENKIYSFTILFLVIVEFIIFKLLYPFPDFFSDSYSYIDAAYRHLDVNIWPIGYSKFLLFFHWFTHSALALNFFQFIFLELSALYFYHTLVYFYPTGKNTRILLCLFLFFNPLNLYLANYVTTDAIFIGLSLIWLTEILWIIHRPRPHQIAVQAVVFFIAFTFRYNAMYYPIIAAAAFLLSKQSIWYKLTGIISGPLLIIPFIIFSSNAAKKMTGTPQFPPVLGGWQWGNNALYMRGFIEEDSTAFPTPETAELDRIARAYFGQPSRPQDQLSSYVANFFIRQPEAPLKQYMERVYKTQGSVENWGKVAPVFGQYGLFLIKRHPLAYARYYLLVNTKNYFLPPLEKLEIYNLGLDDIWPIGVYWFDFPSEKIKVFSKTFQGTLLFMYTALFAVLNLYFMIALILYLRKKGLKKAGRNFNYTIVLVSAFLLLNCVFSVFANIIVIRYQVFPMIMFLAFTMLLTDYLEWATKDPDGVKGQKLFTSIEPRMIAQPAHS
ncbi:hypothetical protein Q4E93_20820 [Flavitalea sp. BT771]|uniref:hypothetical protein n=1 Tax=Flavitalea sp. BT771 TaxID=3063329 RepID=UPI0026E40EDD|nr:hypothetical protein [Flavitalea sp. BT771]MDO6433064.1 hypothetical protein [Flavitalea sp. BT771]MDV6221660.1 hypothetical protein [Flavitalea sp. BT771]